MEKFSRENYDELLILAIHQSFPCDVKLLHYVVLAHQVNTHIKSQKCRITINHLHSYRYSYSYHNKLSIILAYLI